MFLVERIRLPLLAAGVLLAATVASAQSKVGVINLQRAVLESAEIKKASADLEARYRPRQQKIQALEKEIQGIQQQLQAGQGKLTPQAEADLNIQGQRKQREMQRLNEDLQADVDRERNEILTGSSRRMGEVVRQIAEAKALDVVIDVSNTIYFRPALDITSEAIAAYDKAHPPK